MAEATPHKIEKGKENNHVIEKVQTINVEEISYHICNQYTKYSKLENLHNNIIFSTLH